jgi:oligopeptide/dipeptide ABC transporter ATP-binding protein
MTFAVSQRSVVLDGVALVSAFELSLEPGEVHAVVGESGSGKTIAALSVLGLEPRGAVCGGTVSPGHRVAMVLQEPLSALNPVLTVGDQLVETLVVHRQPRELAARLLAEVGIADAGASLRAYPHQLSGGQRQRVSIACALAANPDVLIADEPTTALDATMKHVILTLLRTLAAERRLAVWLVTHDLLSVRDACDRVTVMYAGRVVETGRARDVLGSPRHPYTAALLASAPAATAPGARLPVIEGQLPRPHEVIAGCRFHPRCPKRFQRCHEESPRFVNQVACHLMDQGAT